MTPAGVVDADLRDQIARLEADIEQLSQTLEGCRKAMVLSKVAIATGGIWILVYVLGAIGFDPTLMVGAIAAIIGGIVFLGSNSSTWKETRAAMKAAEARRAEFIDRIDFWATDASRWRTLRR
ncbi:MAG: hypothetical protein WBX05_18890 [Pseudolabrys sp.]